MDSQNNSNDKITWHDLCCLIAFVLFFVIIILFVINLIWDIPKLKTILFWSGAIFIAAVYEVFTGMNTEPTILTGEVPEKHLNRWNSWQLSMHRTQKQVERLDRAVNDDLKIKYINPKLGAGVIIGTTGERYNVFLDRCSCPDFKRRQKPCKHMYRLALELGIIDGPYVN